MDSFILLDKAFKFGTNIRISTKKTKTPPPHVYVCQQTLGTFLCQTSASLDTFATALRTTNMHDKASTTAILIFSRTASREADVKTFDPSLGKSGNKLVARYLIRQTVQTARKTGLPVFLCYDNAAADLSFGQRFADAVEGIFQKGYSTLITIGNDSPELTTKVLTEAAYQLEQNNMVVGPAVDGGIYLLGLGQHQYNRAAFIDLPWQTAQLQHAFSKCFSADHATLVWLDELSDIDNSRDFKALLRRLSVFSGLLIQLLRLLAAQNAPFNSPRPLSFSCFLDIAPFRGPPFSCQCT